MSAKQSRICICSGVPLNNKYEHTLYFDSAAAQLESISSKVVKTFEGYSYLRKNWSIKVKANFEDAIKWNYLYFTNSPTGGKVFYYFITDVQYLNEDTVELFLEMDVMQTYHFDYQLLPCHIERGHVRSDGIGEHVIEENIEFGEYVEHNAADVGLKSMSIVFACTANPNVEASNDGETVPVMGSILAGAYSGLKLYACAATADNARQASTLINGLAEHGKTDVIQNIWMYPTDLIVKGSGDGLLKPVEAISNDENYEAARYEFEGYDYNSTEVRNYKLFTYPYNLLYITNNTGAGVPFRYEWFGNPTKPAFNIRGALSADAGVVMYPTNYNGTQNAYEYGVTLPPFPSCAWISDSYKLWLAQNQHQLNAGKVSAFVSMGSGVVGAVAGLAAGSAAGVGGGVMGIVSGFEQLQNQWAMKKDKSIQPPEARGATTSSLNLAAGSHTFTVIQKSISEANLRRLDRYFDMYGYQLNEIGIPDRAARRHWSFTKTTNCHIEGELPAADMATIENIYNRGVTFWRNINNVCDYDMLCYDNQASHGG